MKRPVFIIGAVFALLLLVFCCLYVQGNIGVPMGKINDEEMDTVSWDREDCDVVSAYSDGGPLYVGIIYKKDYSAANYFIYVKRGGLHFGWHFLQGGNLPEADGVRVFDCGGYGRAYVALNADRSIQTIEFEDDREPAVVEDIQGPVCELSQHDIQFYDADGNLIEPIRAAVIE